MAQANAFELSKELYGRREEWLEVFDRYVDRFKLEILLHLRRGDLKAWGTKLPFVDHKQVWSHLIEEDIDLKDLEVKQVPQDDWVSNHVDWFESSLQNSTDAYCWIYVETSEVLKLFPPRRQTYPDPKGQIRSIVMLTSSSSVSDDAARQGRPPLPWDLFHVEVARLIKEGEFPLKKEAAIAQLIAWFQRELGEKVSRSSVGNKLKPYYDLLIKPKAKS